jgi:hypothetical protein
MKMIGKTLLKHIKGIFDLPTNTSHQRIMLVLGEPDLKIRLAVRLLKNYHKYIWHFREVPYIFNKALGNYFSQEEINAKLSDEIDYDEIKRRLININLKEKAQEYLKCKIRDDHKDFLVRYTFCYPDKRDFFVIRYFTNTTKVTNDRLFPVCECGLPKDLTHVTDFCTLRPINRNKYLKKFGKIFVRNKMKEKESLYDYLEEIFFGVDDKIVIAKDIRKLISLMKDVITSLIIDGKDSQRKDRIDYVSSGLDDSKL